MAEFEREVSNVDSVELRADTLFGVGGKCPGGVGIFKRHNWTTWSNEMGACMSRKCGNFGCSLEEFK